MKCHYHPKEQAFVVCIYCHKALCNSCMKANGNPVCSKCKEAKNKKFLRIMQNKILPSFISILIVFAIGDFLKLNLYYILFFAYVSSCIPCGWSFTNKIISKNKITKLIYSIIFLPKITLSIFCGIFLIPYKFFKFLKTELEISLEIEQMTLRAKIYTLSYLNKRILT